MSNQATKSSDKKEIWAFLGTVTAALITGIVSLIVAGKIPFTLQSATATPSYTASVTVTPILKETVTITEIPLTVLSTAPQPFVSLTPLPELQKVQWIPNNDGLGSAGLCINNWIQTSNGFVCPISNDFIPWDKLKIELEQQMLTLMAPRVPPSSILRLKEGPNNELNWIIQVIAPDGTEVANVWIGNDPLAPWNEDGLIRIGYPYAPITIWATFSRYSDGSYIQR